MEKKLTRPRSNKKIAGVCAGLANYFGLDLTLVRIIYACATIFTAFAGGILYIVLMVLMPEEPYRNSQND